MQTRPLATSTARRWTAAGTVGTLGVALAALTLAPVTRATHVNSARPTLVVLGPPSGIAPMARIDGGRSGRTRFALPEHPKVLWRRSGHSGLDFVSLAVDSAGSIVVPSATTPEVSQVSPLGAPMWRASTGRGPSITGAVLLGNGTRLVATSAGEAVGFSPDGAVRFVTPLGLEERNARLGLLPLEDGGAAITSGREVDEIDSDGRLRQKTRLAERANGALVATLGGPVATGSSGAVHLIHAGFTRELGTFAGDLSEAGASTPDGRILWAVVDHQRIVTIDLATGASQVRFSVNDQSLHGPVVFGRDDVAIFTTWTGVLVSVSSSGADVRRTALEPRFATLITDAGQVDFAALDESPPPLADGEGRTAFARVGARIGIVRADGSVHLVEGTGCSSPAALAPAGPRRFVVGCRDGSILVAGDDSP